MAKGNAFLGTLRRSIGDVTYYRREGEQLARVRVRSVKNPKSTGQSEQRAFFAPVARFFSPFATVLETSYEGLNRSKSYSAFLKQNIALARSRGWYLPKGSQFFPLPYKVSRGSLPPLQYAFNEENVDFVGASINSADATVGNFSKAILPIGYNEGDQITIIVVLNLGDGDFLPDYLRFNLSSDSQELLSSVTAGHQFGLQMSQIGTSGNYRPQVTESDYGIAAIAIIASRKEGSSYKRSTQYMLLEENLLSSVTGLEARANAISSYGPSLSTAGSDVYLNGSDEFVTVQCVDGSTIVASGLGRQVGTSEQGITDYALIGGTNGERRLLVKGTTGLYLNSDLDAWTQYADTPLPATFGIAVNIEDNPQMQQWLLAHGVDPSVFQ